MEETPTLFGPPASLRSYQQGSFSRTGRVSCTDLLPQPLPAGATLLGYKSNTFVPFLYSPSPPPARVHTHTHFSLPSSCPASCGAAPVRLGRLPQPAHLPNGRHEQQIELHPRPCQTIPYVAGEHGVILQRSGGWGVESLLK